MTDPNSTSQDAILAARAVLLTLRAVVKGAIEVKRFQINDQDARSLQHAATVLAGIPKPVRCNARLLDGNILKVVCSGKRPGDDDLNPVAGTAVTATSNLAFDADEECIVFTSADESIVLSPRALDRWAADYAIAEPFGLAGDIPGERERSHGIRWVIKVGGPAFASKSLEDFDLPDDLRTVIRREIQHIEEGSADSEGQS